MHGQGFTEQMIPRQLQIIQMALLIFVKIGLVSAEIFHYIQIRTNVAWTNVDGTNVPETVDNSYRWHNHPIFKVWLSSDQ